MDYCIKNKREVYIKLDPSGTPVTCPASSKGLFDYKKANNIIGCLPKTLQRLGFYVEAIPDISPKKEKNKTIKKENYTPSEYVTRWIDKFGVCADIFDEAKQRETELIIKLEESDKELLDILHIIEIENSKDMFSGWKLYKTIRNNRERRRDIKDELLIVQDVLKEINPDSVRKEKIQKAINGLFNRQYTLRIVEN